MVDVIIVFSGEDEALVGPVAERLKSLGVDVWRFDSSSKSDDGVREGVARRQIDKAGAVLVCWTPHAVASNAVLAQVDDAVWQQKLVACRLTPCVPPSSFDSTAIADLCDWAGNEDAPAWRETVAAIAEKLGRPGLVELLKARISGEGSGLYSFARRFPDEPQAREIWSAHETKYREECASLLRDARLYLEQRATSQEQKIETLLKSFANDFQKWMERERRGEDSPKPDLGTLRDIWLKGEPHRESEMTSGFAASSRDAQRGRRQAELLAELQRANEAAKEALARAQQAEAELAKTQEKFDARNAAMAKADTSARSKHHWPLATLAGGGALVFALGALIGSLLHPVQQKARQPSQSNDSSLITQQSHKQADANSVGQTDDSEVLGRILERRHDETLNQVIGNDPRAALAKLFEIIPQDVAAMAASKMPTLAVREALKASVPQAMAPIAQLPVRDLVKALESTLSPAGIVELTKMLQPLPPATGVDYKSYENLDIPGGDVAKLKNVDLQKCIIACQKRETCRAYTFDKWNHACYLKSNAAAFKLNPRSLSGVRADLDAPKAPSGEVTMERYRFKAFPGPGYKMISAASPETCEHACQTDEACVAYTFNLNENTCRLFSSTGEYFGERSAESGGKRQD